MVATPGGATTSFDAAVLGAGPAGLATALALARDGKSVVVIEQAPHVGGMAASIEVGGQRVDLGSHRLHPSASAEVLDELRRLIGTDLQTRPRNGRVHLAGRWIGFPLRAGDLARALPRPLAARVLVDAATTVVRRTHVDTYAAVVRGRLGPTILAQFYGPYAEKLWDVAPDELDGELARRRISAGSPADLARRVLRARRPAARTFLYPAGGFGQISEALARAADAAGARLELGWRVAALAAPSADAQGSAWQVHIEPTAPTEPAEPTEPAASGPSPAAPALPPRVLDVGLVVSTLPVTALASLVRPAPPPTVAAAADALTYRGMALVYLVVDRPRYTPFDAHYFPGPETVVSRLSEPKNYRNAPDRDPHDRTVLCAEVPCTVGDHTWTTADDALARLVAEQLVRLGLPDPAPVAHRVVRLPRVYPVYRSGFRARLDPLLDWVAGLPRIVSVGRQGLFVPDNAHHAIAMGLAVGDCLTADGDIDPARWQRALDRFAAHVVED